MFCLVEVALFMSELATSWITGVPRPGMLNEIGDVDEVFS